MIVRRSGLREGPPVLLLHALGLDRRAFDPLRHALGGSLDIISYDHRGHGSRASEESFTLQMLVDDALDMIRRSEEHTSELQSLMRNSYAVFCLKKKTQKKAAT